MSSAPVYFELGWSILSTIGLVSTLFGALVAGITNLLPVLMVPIVVSAACAVANGLCYYAFYVEGNPKDGRLVAAAAADIMWLVQEVGLSFYSCLILIHVLRRRARVTFLSLFWTLMIIILALRIAILISRALSISRESTALQDRIGHLHVGYFISIALVESCSSFFLLGVFAAAQKSRVVVFAKSSLLRQLTRSTEIRLATLSVIGITRAITYSFQSAAQSATSTASQVDRFAYTLECLFPLVMMIDLMTSKLAAANHRQEYSSRNRSRQGGNTQDVEFSNVNESVGRNINRQSFVLLESQEPRPFPHAVMTVTSVAA
ncbi:hypothetical protein DL98DRAFT_662504 [Cadophora sp. DSE1049]|nr:hypothetical protein DL98DRAFT_662504 [Cadophora sp. DSE1049]